MPYQEVSGSAHGDEYWRLVNEAVGQRSWDVRFVANADGGVTESGNI